MSPLALAAVAMFLLGGTTVLISAALAQRRASFWERRVSLALRPEAKMLARQKREAAAIRSWLEGALARPRWLFGIGLRRTWGVRTGTTALTGIGLAAAVAALALAQLALHLALPFSLAAAAAGFVIGPRALLRHQQRRAEANFANLFPDTIDMLVRMVRAGLPVAAAVRTVGREAPPTVGSVFATVADEVELGVPFEDALTAMAERIGLPDFRFFAVAVVLQRATGGNLAATLEAFSDIIRRRRAVRLKAHAATAEVRASALILGGLPFLVTGVIALLAPSYLAPLIHDPRGNVILGAAISCLLLAFTVMRWMVRRGTSV